MNEIAYVGIAALGKLRAGSRLSQSEAPEAVRTKTQNEPPNPSPERDGIQ
jgi:hypothetical protein